MMDSSLVQDTGSQEATDQLSFSVLGHQEHAESHHIFRPDVLADGKYAQVHSVQQSQVNDCDSEHSAPLVQVHTANLACLRPPPFLPGGAHAEVAPTKVTPASNAIDQPIWSSPVPEANSRHLATEVSNDLVGRYSPGLKQLPPLDHTLHTGQTIAPVPAPPPMVSVEPMDLQQEQRSHPEEGGSAQFAEVDQVPPNAESQDHSMSTSDPPRAAPIPPRSCTDVPCSGDPSAEPARTSAASSPDRPPPAPALTAASSAAADTAPTPTPTGAGDRAECRPAVPAKEADSEDGRGPAAADSRPPQPPAGLQTESLAVTCDLEVSSQGDGAAGHPGRTVTNGDSLTPAADNAGAVESGAAEPSLSAATPAAGAGELPAIGAVLLSGDRLVFRCIQCPELFSSAGRLRTHHRQQHCPQPAAAPGSTPPAPSPAAGGRGGRPPRSAAAAASAVVAAAAADDDGDSPDACDPTFMVKVEEDAFPGLRRTRSGRTRVPPAPVSLKCDICDKVLSNGNKLAVHQRMHSGERPHVCTYCPKRCNDIGNLRKHEQLHFKPRPFRCGTCGITFRTALRQKAHRCKLSPGPTGRRIAADGDEVAVSENGQETAVGEGVGVESRAANAEGVDGGPLKMDEALGGLPALAAAAELAGARPRREPAPERQPNVNSGLVPVVPVDCDVCGRQLRSISGWQRHRRLHAGVRPYQCRFCDKTCNDSGNMRKHEAGHFKERPYRCGTCSITFINAWRLSLHQCKMRADGGAAAAADGSAGPLPLPAPAAAAAEVEVEAALESRPPLPVPPPRGRHAPPPQLDARGRRRDHVCPICNKALLSYASLEMHYRTHTGEKPYQCDECGQRFSIQGNLVVHARIHTGERPFQCEECGKMFMYQSHLKVHKRGHSGERPYNCRYCNKGFAASSAKRVHEETVHSTERKFICETCGVAFKEKKHLKRHSLKKHQMGGETAA